MFPVYYKSLQLPLLGIHSQRLHGIAVSTGNNSVVVDQTFSIEIETLNHSDSEDQEGFVHHLIQVHASLLMILQESNYISPFVPSTSLL